MTFLFMLGFDKKVVLEQILKDVPVQQNLRGKVEGTNNIIYAYYFNRGMPDPDLKYDLKENPVKTTPDSTLCEIYSMGGPKYKEFVEAHKKRLKTDANYANAEMELSRGYSRHSYEWYQGPWIAGGACTDDEVVEATRGGCSYSYHHSAGWFSDHFNQICERLGYPLRLSDDHIEVDGKKEHLSIDLQNQDPAISRILDLIEKAYQKFSQ